MDQSTSGDAPGTGLAWADVEACTLPTADRPLRVAEFDDLFTTSLRSIDQPSDTHAHLVLTGDHELAHRARRLSEAETACCSFFTFTISEPQPGHVSLDIEVPPAHADVLTGLLDRARAVLAAAS
jgi:hypothetical protein